MHTVCVYRIHWEILAMYATTIMKIENMIIEKKYQL